MADDQRESFATPAHQAAYLTDAWLSGDPYLITLALKEIGTARRVPVALDENPPLGEVLRAMSALGFAARFEPGGQGSCKVCSAGARLSVVAHGQSW